MPIIEICAQIQHKKVKRMEKSIASQRSNIRIEKSTRGLYHILRFHFQTLLVFAFIFKHDVQTFRIAAVFRLVFPLKLLQSSNDGRHVRFHAPTSGAEMRIPTIREIEEQATTETIV